MRTLINIAVTVALACCFVFASTNASEESKRWPASDKAKKFVKDTIVLDFFASPHGVGWNKPEHLLGYVDRAMETGITGTSATLAATYYTWEEFLKEHHLWRTTLLEGKKKVLFVKHAEDIERAHKEGKYAFIWNSQTTSILNGDLTKIATLRGMGLGSMQLVYNGTYRAGVGCSAALHQVDTGLTPWGRTVIDEMVKQGVVVDLSHASLKTTDDAVAYVTKKHPGTPVIYSHCCPAGHFKTAPEATPTGCYRNISDEQAKKCAATGGYVAPTFTEWMMDGVWPDDISPKQCADMIDYYVKLIGVDHVGIATDDMFTLKIVMGFVKKNPDQYNDDGYMVRAFDRGAAGCGELAKILPAVTDELWKMGYSNEDIAKIYGGNAMRVFKQVWK